MNHFLALEGNEHRGILSREDSHHALRVLRLKIGDEISVSYGDGKVFRAQVSEDRKNALAFEILAHRRTQVASKLSIAIAPTKSNDRFEIALEKCTEFGIHEFIPIVCDHSERKVYKKERGQRVIEAAFKQSHKGFLPKIYECISFQELIAKSEDYSNRYIAALDDQQKAVNVSNLNLEEEALVLIGPEGDFSHREIDLALESGFKLLSLGAEVLRTETAALLLAALANAQMDYRSHQKS